MKKQIALVLIVIAVIIIAIWAFSSAGGPQAPEVGPEGQISGNYTLESIMGLGKPYVCTFSKSDATSIIAGVLHTDGDKVYSEFRIRTDLAEDDFSSFLILRDGESYTWSSLHNLGYKGQIASSASVNASPQEQAQIIGLEDEMPYECEPWQDPDETIFETPPWITFMELENA